MTAQLINVEDGFHLWSQTYDRNVDDAFAIQTEVAETVAEKLKAHPWSGPKTPPRRARAAGRRIVCR